MQETKEEAAMSEPTFTPEVVERLDPPIRALSAAKFRAGGVLVR